MFGIRPDCFLRLVADLLHSCGQAHVDGYDCGERGDYEQQFPGLYFSFSSVADFLFRSVLFVFHFFSVVITECKDTDYVLSVNIFYGYFPVE